MTRAREVALRSPDGFLAFGFGSGLLSRAPGTMGTVAAVPFAFAIPLLDGFTLVVFLTIAFLGGSWICQRVAQRLGVEDYGGIVWDEIIGMYLTLMALPAAAQPIWILIAFGLFRLADIWKPWPIRDLDHRLGGGLGIMLDDVIAGLYAALMLLVLQRFLY